MTRRGRWEDVCLQNSQLPYNLIFIILLIYLRLFAELDHESLLGVSLSGNQLMITGSKHLHCPPPDGYAPGKILLIYTTLLDAT